MSLLGIIFGEKLSPEQEARLKELGSMLKNAPRDIAEVKAYRRNLNEYKGILDGARGNPAGEHKRLIRRYEELLARITNYQQIRRDFGLV